MGLPDSVEAWARALTMLPIVVCSVVGSAITLSKWMQLRRSRTEGDTLLRQVRGLVRSGEYARALALTRPAESHAARLIERSLSSAGEPPHRLTEQVEEVGRQLARDLDYGVGGVGLIAALGPLLGLFGTVVGIVLVFERIAAAEGAVSAQQLAGGIGTALYTTVAGLVVGILALVSHRLLAAAADGAIAQLEAIGQEMVRLIDGSVT